MEPKVKTIEFKSLFNPTPFVISLPASWNGEIKNEAVVLNCALIIGVSYIGNASQARTAYTRFLMARTAKCAIDTKGGLTLADFEDAVGLQVHSTEMTTAAFNRKMGGMLLEGAKLEVEKEIAARQ